jgi:hypothetical protein
MFDDEKLEFAANADADQTVTEAPAKKRRARTKAAAPTVNIGNRGRGRPKGAKNKTTLALEAAREQLDKAKIGSNKQALKEPKDILLESANYFWDRAQWLSSHAKKLANEAADARSIQAIMDEAEGQLVLACKCATDAAPYFNARIIGPIPDGDAVVAYVARLPAPLTTNEWEEKYSPDHSPNRWKQGGSH